MRLSSQNTRLQGFSLQHVGRNVYGKHWPRRVDLSPSRRSGHIPTVDEKRQRDRKIAQALRERRQLLGALDDGSIVVKMEKKNVRCPPSPCRLWQAVWGKSQRAKLICSAQPFYLFPTESRNSGVISKLRRFVVSARTLRPGAQLSKTQRNFVIDARNSLDGKASKQAKRTNGTRDTCQPSDQCHFSLTKVNRQGRGAAKRPSLRD